MERCAVMALGEEARSLVARAGSGPWTVVGTDDDEMAAARVVVVVADRQLAAKRALLRVRDHGRASVHFASSGGLHGEADLVVRGEDLRALLFWARSCRSASELGRARLVTRREPAELVMPREAHRLRHLHVAGDQALLAATHAWFAALPTFTAVTVHHEEATEPHVTALLADPVVVASDGVSRFRARVEAAVHRFPPTKEYAVRLRHELDWWLAADDRMLGIMGLADAATDLAGEGFLATPYLAGRGGGSLVVYALGLTPFDPVVWGLRFAAFVASAPIPQFMLGLSARGYEACGGRGWADARGAEGRWAFGFAPELDALERPYTAWSLHEPGDGEILPQQRFNGRRELEIGDVLVPPEQQGLERLAAHLELSWRPERDDTRLAWDIDSDDVVQTDHERDCSVPEADARSAGILVYRDQVAEAVAEYLDVPLHHALRFTRRADAERWKEKLGVIDDIGQRLGNPRLAELFNERFGARCVARRTRAQSLGEALVVLEGLRRGMSFSAAGISGKPPAIIRRDLQTNPREAIVVVVDDTTSTLAATLAQSGTYLVELSEVASTIGIVIAGRLVVTRAPDRYEALVGPFGAGLVDIQQLPDNHEVPQIVLDAIDALSLRDRANAGFVVILTAAGVPTFRRVRM